jgi:hypothetical protein
VNCFLTENPGHYWQIAYRGLLRPAARLFLLEWLSPGTDLALGVATTNCSSGACVGVPFSIATQWLSLFVSRHPEPDLSSLTHVEFDWLSHQSAQKYKSMIGTDDPDLSAFRSAGGKIVTLHGLVSVPGARLTIYSPSTPDEVLTLG